MKLIDVAMAEGVVKSVQGTAQVPLSMPEAIFSSVLVACGVAMVYILLKAFLVNKKIKHHIRD